MAIENAQVGEWTRGLKLAHMCPGEVNGVKIKNGTRELLKTLAFHRNGVTGVTFVSERTLKLEMSCDKKKLDRSIAALKKAGLLTTTQMICADGTFDNNVWRINVELLEQKAGPKQDDAGLEQAIAAVQRDGECRVTTSAARVEETRSRLYRIAGAYKITVIEEQELTDRTILLVRPKKEGLVADAAVFEEAAPAAPPTVKDNTPAAAGTTRKKSATPPSQVIIDTLLSLEPVGKVLSPGDAQAIAKSIVAEFGEDEALLAVDRLTETALQNAVKKDNKVGYMITCIRAAHKKMPAHQASAPEPEQPTPASEPERHTPASTRQPTPATAPAWPLTGHVADAKLVKQLEVAALWGGHTIKASDYPDALIDEYVERFRALSGPGVVVARTILENGIKGIRIDPMCMA
jgi:hypothetical protein